MVMTEEEVRIGLGLPPPVPPTLYAAEDTRGSPLARRGVVPVVVPGRTGRVHMCICSTVRRRGFQQGDVVDEVLWPCLSADVDGRWWAYVFAWNRLSLIFSLAQGLSGFSIKSTKGHEARSV